MIVLVGISSVSFRIELLEPRRFGFKLFASRDAEEPSMARTASLVRNAVAGIRLPVIFALPNIRGMSRSLHVPSISSTRLNETIHSTSSAWGAAHRWGQHETETGMARLALSDDDASVRRWFVEQTKSLGCSVTVDQMGNTYAVRPGRRSGAPPTAIGSHLDTQPSGGRYDGILGVVAGVEALRTLVQEGIEAEFPVAVINWTKLALDSFCLIAVLPIFALT
jgi:hypothetical protein